MTYYEVILNPAPATLCGTFGCFDDVEEARDKAAEVVGLARIVATPSGYTENADPAWDEPCSRIHRGESIHEKLPDNSHIWIEER